jgi:hypothetical protein
MASPWRASRGIPSTSPPSLSAERVDFSEPADEDATDSRQEMGEPLVTLVSCAPTNLF